MWRRSHRPVDKHAVSPSGIAWRGSSSPIASPRLVRIPHSPLPGSVGVTVPRMRLLPTPDSACCHACEPDGQRFVERSMMLHGVGALNTITARTAQGSGWLPCCRFPGLDWFLTFLHGLPFNGKRLSTSTWRRLVKPASLGTYAGRQYCIISFDLHRFLIRFGTRGSKVRILSPDHKHWFNPPSACASASSLWSAGSPVPAVPAGPGSSAWRL